MRARLEAERGPVLLLHAGDFLYPSILSRTYKGGQMIDVLDQLDGSPSGFDERMFITFGNHEFDDAKEKAAADIRERIDTSQFLWLASNIVFRAGPDGRRMVESPHLLVEEKLRAHDILFCGKVNRPAGCLSEVVGQARTKLVAEELEIRKYETNLGNWIADLARSAYQDADIAFLNSGALRLNQDIPPGPIPISPAHPQGASGHHRQGQAGGGGPPVPGGSRGRAGWLHDAPGRHQQSGT